VTIIPTEEEIEQYNNWLLNPHMQFGTSPFIIKQQLVKEGDRYVLKEIIVSPNEYYKSVNMRNINEE
jgi:hypothetical protein